MPYSKTDCPDPFPISPELRLWAAKNAPRLDIDWHTAEMVDYWRGHGRRMANWDATWRNWMRRAVDFKGARFLPVQRYPAQAGNVHDLVLQRSARQHGIDPTGKTESEINNLIWQKGQKC